MKPHRCHGPPSQSGRGEGRIPMLITPQSKMVIAGPPSCSGASAKVPPSHLHGVNDGLGCGASQRPGHEALLHVQGLLLPSDGPLDLRMGHVEAGESSGLEPLCPWTSARRCRCGHRAGEEMPTPGDLHTSSIPKPGLQVRAHISPHPPPTLPPAPTCS